ncbi:hypothetical protein QOT17_014139 [Balamuthia mandrillaris]
MNRDPFPTIVNYLDTETKHVLPLNGDPFPTMTTIVFQMLLYIDSGNMAAPATVSCNQKADAEGREDRRKPETEKQLLLKRERLIVAEQLTNKPWQQHWTYRWTLCGGNLHCVSSYGAQRSRERGRRSFQPSSTLEVIEEER